MQIIDPCSIAREDPRYIFTAYKIFDVEDNGYRYNHVLSYK
jgi:hypothetical protein